MIRAIVYLSVLLFTLPGQAQDYFADVPHQNVDKVMVEINGLIRQGERKRSTQLIQQVYQAGKKENDPIKIVKALAIEADWLNYFAQYDSATAKAEAAVAVAETNNLQSLLPQLHLKAGMLSLRKKNPQTSLDHCNTAKAMAQQASNLAVELQCDFCIEDAMGRYYYEQGQTTDKPRYALEKVLPAVIESGDTMAFQMYLSRYIDMYRSFGTLDSVWLLLSQLESSLDAFPNVRRKASLHSLRAVYYELREIPDSVVLELNRAKTISQGMKVPEVIMHYYLRLATFYNETAQYKEALAMTDSAMAVYPDFELFLYEYYYDIYKNMGDASNTLHYLEQWVAVRDSLREFEKLSYVTEWETKYETKEKENQLQAQQSRQKLLLIILVAILLTSIGLIWAYRSKQKANRLLSQQKTTIEQQAEELKSLEKLKSRFFANVSHELRTPLSLIIGPLDTLLKKENDRPEKEQQLLNFVKNNSQHLLKLVNEILDLSKLETGKLEVKETAVNFQEFLQPLVAQFSSVGESNSLNLNFKYQADLHLDILIDIGKFEKIAHNYLSNALKFTPADGQIDFTVEDKGKELLISVKDNGSGIHPEDLPHVFDRFYQSKQANAPVQGGTGIGLSLCKELAELLEGKVWAESEWGKGSSFYFQFPKKLAAPGQELVLEPEPSLTALAPTSALSEKVSPKAAQNTDRPLILLVEDNHDLRNYLQSILEENHEVLTAENGKVAWELLTSRDQRQKESEKGPTNKPKTVDLIISDLMMPIMDGFQLLSKLKAHETLRYLPFIMLTARADVRVKLRALRYGVDDYITKPFTEEELLVRINNLLRNQQERILAKTNQADGNSSSDSSELALSQQNEWLEELEKNVTAELGNINLTADFLAHQMALSRRQLYRRMKELTGLSINDYVNEVRYQKARQMLEDRTVLSVKAAAYSVGMKDVSYFSRRFKQRFGKAPSAYLN